MFFFSCLYFIQWLLYLFSLNATTHLLILVGIEFFGVSWQFLWSFFGQKLFNLALAMLAWGKKQLDGFDWQPVRNMSMTNIISLCHFSLSFTLKKIYNYFCIVFLIFLPQKNALENNFQYEAAGLGTKAIWKRGTSGGAAEIHSSGRTIYQRNES